jgi:hypothetical protein
LLASSIIPAEDETIEEVRRLAAVDIPGARIADSDLRQDAY